MGNSIDNAVGEEIDIFVMLSCIVSAALVIVAALYLCKYTINDKKSSAKVNPKDSSKDKQEDDESSHKPNPKGSTDG